MIFKVVKLNSRPGTVFPLACLLALQGGCIVSGGSRAIPDTTPGERPTFEEAERLVVEQSNLSRLSVAATEVRPNSQLTAAARGFAEYLAKTGRFEHHADGRNVLVRATAVGYRPQVICENLFECSVPAGITTRELAKAAVDGWLRSEGHRRSLLDKRVREIGVGVAGDPVAGKYYVVEVLARPLRTVDVNAGAFP